MITPYKGIDSVQVSYIENFVYLSNSIDKDFDSKMSISNFQLFQKN